jgi:hypothetical protein
MAVSRLSQTTLQNAFQKFNNVWDGRSAVGSMEAIASFEVTAATSSVSFFNIPQNYTNLEVRIVGKTTRATTSGSTIFTTVNGDTGSTNYRGHYVVATHGSYTVTSGSLSQDGGYYLFTGLAMGASAANQVTANVMNIFDYANTNKYKTSRTIFGENNNTTGYSGVYQCLWMNTAAITSLSFVVTSYTWAIGSKISLYGIK